MPRNALSVDVEDWFQVGAFERVIDKADWDTLAPRVERNTDAVLALFADTGVKATFFTLGWVAGRYPALIRRIVAAGHELASHGWDHQRVFTMTAGEFRADLARARDALEQAGGVAITGYRAPRLLDRCADALGVLRAGGSQVCLFVLRRAVAPRSLRLARCAALRFSPACRCRADRAAGHGGATRAEAARDRRRFLSPAPRCAHRFRGAASERGGAAGHFLLSPVGDRPRPARVANAPLRSRLRHYSRLGAMAGKLRGLIGRHEWGRVDEVIASCAPAQAGAQSSAATRSPPAREHRAAA